MRSTHLLSAIAVLSATIAIAQADDALRPKPRPMQPYNGGGAPSPNGGGGTTAPDTAFAPRPPENVPPPVMPTPVPAPEVVAAAKAMKGTWRCRGFLSQPDGSSSPTTGTMKIAADLDGFWLTSDYTEAKTRAKTPGGPHPTHVRMSRTFDAGTRTWTAITLANNGGNQVQTSTDLASPMTWTGTLAMGGVKVATRDHEEYDAKTRVNHIWGEFSLDGKSFLKTYDLRCQK
ncbi:MAG: hypothetical protein K8W52_38475 [Deltaproteobacteria bacterium]|nr:hypothetical protein [Deltaproteobacteria bacterium]